MESKSQDFAKNCQIFLWELERIYPHLYKQVVKLLLDWKTGKKDHQQTILSYQKIVVLLQDLNGPVLLLNKVLNRQALIGRKQNKIKKYMNLFQNVNQQRYRELKLILMAIKKFNGSRDIENRRRIFDLIQDKNHSVIKYAQQLFQIPHDLRKQHKKLQQVPLTFTYKNQYHFFDKIKNKFSFIAFQNLIKILHLYYLFIITVQQTVQLLKPVLDQKDLQMLRDSLLARQFVRRKISHFRPLHQMDFSKYERLTYSYVKMPQTYPNICSGKSKQSLFLNDKWISVPYGSQHFSFSIMRKNQYEEELFKHEDQKFEIDNKICLYKNAIKQLMKKGGNIQNQVLSKLYRDDFIKIQQWLINNRSIIHSIIGNRIQTKLQQLRTGRKLLFKQWTQSSEKNFHKSLDHRSFYFKKNDKKILSNLRLQRQCQFRYYMIHHLPMPSQLVDNKDNFDTNVTKYDKVFNSFEGISNISRCQYVQEQEDYMINFSTGINRPIFKYNLYNQKTSSETLNVILFNVSNSALFSNQLKQKLNQMLTYYFSELLRIQLIQYVYVPDYRIVGLVKIIQNRIFDKAVGEEELEEQKKKKDKKVADKYQDKNNLDSQFYSIISQSTNQMNYDLNQSQHIVNCSKHLLIFFRLFYTIYERFQKAKQLSGEFEENKKTEKISQEEKQEISKERYQLFKGIVANRGKSEDLYRGLYGQNAYVFFTMDKLMVHCMKTLLALVNDEFSMKLYQLQKCQKNSNELLSYIKVNKLLFEIILTLKNFYRVIFTCKKNLYIYYFQTVFKHGLSLKNIKNSHQIANYFVNQYTQKNQIKQKRQIQAQNHLEYGFGQAFKNLNSFKGQDYTIAKTIVDINSSMQIQKANKFYVWLNNK